MEGLAGAIAATGTEDPYLMDTLINQALNAAGSVDDRQERSKVDLANIALGELFGIGPLTPLEGMLAVQMVAAHNLSLQLVGRANWNQDFECRVAYGNLAAKMMRTFTAQIEALLRLRGQTTKQVVRVEHVHVEAGARAVVGAVKVEGRSEAGS